MNPAELAGLISKEIGETLRGYAAKVPRERAIVEIGSYKGKSTCYLATGAQSGGGAHVWAVDPWDTAGNVTGRFGYADPATREAFERQVSLVGMGAHITAVKGFSVAVARSWTGPPIGLLYIDGDHSERAVRGDYVAWREYLTPGAIVIFDDFDTPRNPGVRAALERLGLIYRIEAGHLAVVSHA
jgi:hypothetical protein